MPVYLPVRSRRHAARVSYVAASGPLALITVRSLNVNTRSADESEGVTSSVGYNASYV